MFDALTEVSARPLGITMLIGALAVLEYSTSLNRNPEREIAANMAPVNCFCVLLLLSSVIGPC